MFWETFPLSENPFYREDMESECKQFMLMSIRLWLTYLEMHPSQVPADIVFSLDEIVETMQKEDITTKEIALAYEGFFNEFSKNPNTFEKLFRLPLLFLVPEIK